VHRGVAEEIPVTLVFHSKSGYRQKIIINKCTQKHEAAKGQQSSAASSFLPIGAAKNDDKAHIRIR
jgi:hypothetical protein